MTILARITCEIARRRMSDYVAKPVSVAQIISGAPAQADNPQPTAPKHRCAKEAS